LKSADYISLQRLEEDFQKQQILKEYFKVLDVKLESRRFIQTGIKTLKTTATCWLTIHASHNIKFGLIVDLVTITLTWPSFPG
jgi:hypothetical protein